MTEIFYMPMRGERTAPILDGTRARDLPRTFTDIETLFCQAKITDDNEKKKQVVYYTDVDTEQLWKYIPEFDDPTSTYGGLYSPPQFKTGNSHICSECGISELRANFRNSSEHIPINSEQLL